MIPATQIRPSPCRAIACAAAILVAAFSPARAADFEVTAAVSDSNYTVDGTPGSPELVLVRGRSYTFHVDVCDCHPMQIVGAPSGAVVNNNISSGIITFNVPAAAVNYSYRCSVHLFGNTLRTVAPTLLSPIQNWRRNYFGSISDAGNGADLFDFDNDGVINFFEFAFGLDPTRASSMQLPQGQLQGGNLVVTFTQPVGVAGITYGAEWSATMLPGSWEAIPDTGIAGEHSFSVPVDGTSRLFLRLTVEYEST